MNDQGTNGWTDLWWQTILERMEAGRSTRNDTDAVRGLLDEKALWVQHRGVVDSFVSSWQSAEALVLAVTAVIERCEQEGASSIVPQSLMDDLEECLEDMSEDGGWNALYN